MMAASLRASTVSPISFSHSPPDSPEPGETSSLGLIAGRRNPNRNSTSTSVTSISKTPIHKSRSHYTFTGHENIPPSHSLRLIDCPGMDDEKLLSMAKRARKQASASALTSTPQSRELSKRRSQYYGEIFAYREPHQSARERVTRDSMVMAELKTNVILKDEYTLITDLSSHLALRYQRPESSILITLSHSTCLLLSGSFDPAYILTITALSSQIAPVTNKRNALLTANFLKDALRVPEKRGIIRFQPITEENLAAGGKTVLGEIETLEQGLTDDHGARRSLERKKNRKTKSMTLMSLTMPLSKASSRSKTPTVTAGVVSPIGMPSRGDGSSTLAETPNMEMVEEQEDELGDLMDAGIVRGTGTTRPKVRGRKSFMALFGK